MIILEKYVILKYLLIFDNIILSVLFFAIKKEDPVGRKVKKKGINKKREYHVKKRGMERFGIFLSKRDQEQMIRIIREGRAILLRRESNTKSHYKLEYKGTLMRVVYIKDHKCLLTVIPLKNKQKKAI